MRCFPHPLALRLHHSLALWRLVETHKQKIHLYHRVHKTKMNTSFNVRGEPIVCTPEDALRCFLATEMDVLVLEHCIIRKTDNASTQTTEERQRHLAKFDLD